MNKITGAVLAIALGTASIATAVNAKTVGTYLRKGEQLITVHIEDNLLYCTRNSDGFELCNGMTEQEDGTWTGKNMRHPDMPRFMKFNGTVTFADGMMSLKGCAFGDSLCDSEDWPNQ